MQEERAYAAASNADTGTNTTSMIRAAAA